MVSSILLYLGIIFAGIILGIIITMVIFYSITLISDKKKKRDIPKAKEDVSKYIKENKDFFQTSGNNNINIKEEVENDRRKYEEFREFEKLRRIAKDQNGNGGKRQHDIIPEGDGELRTGELLQDKPDSSSTTNNRKVRFD